MDASSALSAISGALPILGTVLQTFTALAAVTIGVITYRYTRRQSALTLINHNNMLANLVNTTVIQSETARDVVGRLHEVVVGCPDDAVLFLYLNYVHNTYRMRQIGAVSTQVWQDTLACCAGMLSKLRREQVERLLARGYERAFQAAVLARFDAAAPTRALVETDVLTRCARAAAGQSRRQSRPDASGSRSVGAEPQHGPNRSWLAADLQPHLARTLSRAQIDRNLTRTSR